MNNLWIFGCSHATGDYNLLLDEQPWTSIVASTLNLVEQNNARSGSSNDAIVASLIDNITSIATDDRIIVMMTYPHRIQYDNKDLVPAKQSDAWWYRTVIDENFYATKFLHQLLSLHYLLASRKYYITFTDPTVLFKLAAHNKHIKQFFSSNCFFLPKLTLTKSYPIGLDQKHMSHSGHIELSKYMLTKVN